MRQDSKRAKRKWLLRKRPKMAIEKSVETRAPVATAMRLSQGGRREYNLRMPELECSDNMKMVACEMEVQC
jgi:hypothetical protein